MTQEELRQLVAEVRLRQSELGAVTGIEWRGRLK
jgi:hypothetical protein